MRSVRREIMRCQRSLRESKGRENQRYVTVLCVSLAKYIIHVPTQCHACNHNGDIHLVQVSLELTVPMRHLRTLILCRGPMSVLWRSVWIS